MKTKKRKKLKFLFHFKTKIEYPFRPTDSQSVYGKHNSKNYFFEK